MHKYEIIDMIDEGAYGIVWKAMNKQTHSLEFKEGDQDEFSRKTIQRQIKMLKMLKSDYVVGIKEAFKKKGKIYLIFQYFDRNLLNLIEKYENGLEPQLIHMLVYKIIKCLQYLHSKNIIHRDVKPENILLNSDYSILKICDFGFARFLPEKQYDMTEYVATRWYRSPELLVGEPYGKSSDMWAIGCMIGQLVDGQPMFPGDDEIDQIYTIKKTIGDLTKKQEEYYKNNPKFADIELPQVKQMESIDTRYLGKIQKNALNFMKACLKMNPSQRITVQQALKHPYLINLSLEDNQFNNDQQNLLNTLRKNPMKNQSKVSLMSIQDEDQKVISLKDKYTTDINKKGMIKSKQGLKFQSGSLVEKIAAEITKNEQNETFLKKKSHTNLHSIKNDVQVPKQEIKIKKMSKIMSEEKNFKVNVDVNLKINLKINSKAEHKNFKQQIQSKLASNSNIKNKLLPNIKNASKDMRYHLNIHHQKVSQIINVIGESKELIRGSRNNLLN